LGRKEEMAILGPDDISFVGTSLIHQTAFSGRKRRQAAAIHFVAFDASANQTNTEEAMV
jgi:hypothetical protein